MALQRWTFTVDPSEAGLRLDQLIAARTELSRRQAREALQVGGVQVARKRVRVAGKVVAPGTEVRVAFDPHLPPAPRIEIPIVFEDDALLAVDKPAGLPTQGTWASDQHDLLAMLRKQRPDLKLFLHHRLDLGTSGLLVFAKDPKANPSLTKQFTEGGVRKAYLARLSEPLGPCAVDRPIGRLRHADPGRFGCEGDLIDPKASRTDFEEVPPELLETLEGGPWILARPRTGRTHQIRVHLASLGRPILGDALYGGAPSDRLWLHAWRLSLAHPITGAPLELEAPPTRFRRTCVRATRQLGTWGTALLLAPLLWLGADFLAWSMAQAGYRGIPPMVRAYRVPQGPVPDGGAPVTDPLTLTELKKYAAVWELEPGACARFPERDAWPWHWNPLASSGDLLRLRQKQSFLLTQHHQVFRQQRPDGTRLYALAPDPAAALGGRRFRLVVKDGELLQAWELPALERTP